MALSGEQIVTLANELTNDPLGVGYSTMSDSGVVGSLETEDRPHERPSLSGSEIVNAIVPSEYDALLATQQGKVKWVTQLGDVIDIRPGTNVRAVLLDAFGAGTTTRDNLANLVQTTISRAVELGISGVKVGDVQLARTL